MPSPNYRDKEIAIHCKLKLPPEDAYGFGSAAIAIIENCMAHEAFDCQEGYLLSTMEI